MKSLNNILSNDIITYPQYANKTLSALASDNSGLITYEMNEHGYRASKLFKTVPQYNVLTLGCSWTMGIGVDNDLIWPTLMGDKLGEFTTMECMVHLLLLSLRLFTSSLTLK